MNQTGISSYTEPQLAELVKEMGQPAFRAKQLFKWLHEKQARSFSEMTDQPKAFLAALEEKLRQQDSQFAAEAYTALEDYMVTDIASGTAAKIGEKLKQYKQLDTLTIDGENVIENGYWAYHLDESSREATVLQLFYEKVR